MTLLRAASLIALVSLFSKGIGLFRDVLIAAYYGNSAATDAYTIAYTLPGFALVMLGGLNGPFHSTVTAVVGRYQSPERRTLVWTLSVMAAVLMGALSLLGMWASEPLVRLYAPQLAQWHPETFRLTVQQLQVMFPLFFLSGLIGISYGLLNLREHYLTPALSPIMASLAIMGAVVFGNHSYGPVILAWGTLLGGVLQLGLQLLPLFGKVKLAPFRWDPRHEGVKLAMGMLLPAVLSSTIGQAVIIIHTVFASGLPEGSWAAYNVANKLLQLPLGILLTALLVPLLPMLTRSAQQGGDFATLRQQTNQGLRSLVLLTIPATVVLWILGEPLVRVLFERGAFDAADTAETAYILVVLAMGMIPYAWRDLLVRVFYALGDAKVPFWSSIASIALVVPLDWLLVGPFGSGGIALTTLIVTLAQALVLGLWLKHRIGAWQEWETLKVALMGTVSGVPFALGCYGVLMLTGRGLVWDLGAVGIGVTILMGIYVLTLQLMGCQDVQILTGHLKARLGRS